MSKHPTPKVPISVCLIAKNEKKNLGAFWHSLKHVLINPNDEVILVDTGSTDGTIKAARKLGWKVISRPDLCSLDMSELGKKWKPEHWETYSKHPHFTQGMLRSFAEARQISFDAAKNEMCMWIDLDDELVNGILLRGMVDEVVGKTAPGQGAAVFLRYDYAFDEDGQCNTILWRERVVSKSHFYWKGLCHETLLPRGGDQLLGRDVNSPVVIRHRAPKSHEFSDLRNYIILRKDFEIDGNFDPRTLFYLGNACRGLKDHEESVAWYNKFVHRSGSRDDVMAARINMAYCFSEMGRDWKGIKECKEAQIVNPEDPRPFYTEAGLWAKLENWDNVITSIKLGDQLQLKDTLHAVDPSTLTFQPALLLTRAYREKHMPEAALEAGNRMIATSPHSSIARKIYEDLQRWATAEMGGQMIFNALSQAKKPPVEILKNFYISQHFLDRGVQDLEEAQPGDTRKPTIAFYCGQSATRWGPPSIEKGVGASEKMVYEAARRLVKKGYNVQVYCRLNREEGQCEEGIHWRYSGRYDPSFYRDIVVLWRMPALVNDIPFECGKLYVWMHDVGDNKVWTSATLQKITKVLFLSEFQRGLHPNVPDEKVYITRNGIDLPLHTVKLGEKKKKKIVYFSSPDRGWLSAIEIFKRAGLAERGYELHMFYGFGELWKQMCASPGWSHIVELSRDMRMYEYEDWCREAASKTPGVVYRGSVGWLEMAEEIKSAEIWLYPTKFDEISCVSAMEAMAGGCKCVTTDHAALKETMKGYPAWFLLDQSDENCHLTLVEAADTSVNPPVAAKFAEKFDMDRLIDKWAVDLMEVKKDDFRPTDNRGPEADGEKRFNIL